MLRGQLEQLVENRRRTLTVKHLGVKSRPMMLDTFKTEVETRAPMKNAKRRMKKKVARVEFESSEGVLVEDARRMWLNGSRGLLDVGVGSQDVGI